MFQANVQAKKDQVETRLADFAEQDRQAVLYLIAAQQSELGPHIEKDGCVTCQATLDMLYLGICRLDEVLLERKALRDEENKQG